MRNRPLLQMIVIGVIAVAIGIPIALIIPWFPSKGSTQAGNVRTLYDVLLIASVPIFVLVETVVLFSVWKFRMRPGEEEKDGAPIHGNTRLEVVWTAVPAILIVSLCTYAYTVLRSNEKNHANAVTVNVTARQFAFQFNYQANGKNIVTSQLYLAKNQPVVFKIRSYDVVHSFFVPSFSEKIDAVPGIVTTLRVTPNVTGTYPVECTELCGAGHSLMRTSVHVVTAGQLAAWAAAQPNNGPPPVGTPPQNNATPIPGSSSAASAATSAGSGTSTQAATSATRTTGATSGTGAAAGKTVFMGTAGCSGCHTLAAAGASGTVGPNLDVRLRTDCATAASKRIRGGTLQQCIDTAITKPYAYLPSGYPAGVMPPNFAQTLTAGQIQALVNFLSTMAK